LIEVKDKYIKTLHRLISSKIVMLENQKVKITMKAAKKYSTLKALIEKYINKTAINKF
jgi:hypothetical protein